MAGMTKEVIVSQTKRSSILRDFLEDEAAGGIVLIAAALLAMTAANSPLAADYFHLLHVETGPVLAPKLGPMTVHLWVNDALMAGFFFLVGLEIKRELIDGEVSRPADRTLPVIAAAAMRPCSRALCTDSRRRRRSNNA